MRWRWHRPEPVDPNHGRDATGRLIDGDRVRPDGGYGWADLLPARPVDTPTRQRRSRGGRR